MRIGTDKKALQYLFENDSVDLIVAEFERLQGVINSLGDSKQSISDDYAALAAENESRKMASAEVAAAFLALPSPHNQVGRLADGIESLAAENERLRNVIGADAIDKEYGMCCDSSSQVERMRKAAQAVDLAFQTLENGLIETPHWVRQQAMRDAVSQLRAAAKEGGAK